MISHETWKARRQDTSRKAERASKKWRIWVQCQDPEAPSLEFPLPAPPMRNRIPPFQGMGASLCPSPRLLPRQGCEHHVGISGSQDCLLSPETQPQIPPKNLNSVRSQGPSEGLTVPAFILARSSHVPDSTGNGEVHRQGGPKAPLGGGPREHLRLPVQGQSPLLPQRRGLLLLQPGATRPSEPQRNATVRSTVTKHRARGRGRGPFLLHSP